MSRFLPTLDQKSGLKNNMAYAILLANLSIILLFLGPKEHLASFSIIPHINIAPSIPLLIITLLGALVLLLNFSKLSMVFKDKISFFLLFYIPLSLVPALYSPDVSKGRVLIYVLILTSYLVGREYRGLFSTLEKTLILFSIVVSIQTIVTFFYIIQDSFRNTYFASYMRIPVGATNIIPSFITPTLLMMYSKPIKLKFKLPVILLLLTSVALTKSRGAIALAITLSAGYFLAFKGGKLRKNITVKTLMLLLLLFVVLSILVLSILGFETVDDFSNGRLSLFQAALSQWKAYPLTGFGMVYPEGFTGTHNIILEVLRETGLFGLVFFGIALFAGIGQALKSLKYSNSSPLALFVISMFLNALFEVSYYNFRNDFVFWFVIGAITFGVNKEEDKFSDCPAREKE